MNKMIRFTVATLLVLFILLTVTVHLRLWQAFDWETLTALQNAIPRWTDVLFSVLTLLGSAEITGLIILALVVFAPSAQRLPLILTFGLAALIELLGKTFIDQPITPHDLVRYIPLLPILIFSAKVNPEFSYPSGHATRTTFIMLILASMISASRWRRSTKRALYLALFLIEIVMLISRVYLAEHWTTDMIGGTILGIVFALIALRWKIPLPKFLERKPF